MPSSSGKYFYMKRGQKHKVKVLVVVCVVHSVYKVDLSCLDSDALQKCVHEYGLHFFISGKITLDNL